MIEGKTKKFEYTEKMTGFQYSIASNVLAKVPLKYIMIVVDKIWNALVTDTTKIIMDEGEQVTSSSVEEILKDENIVILLNKLLEANGEHDLLTSIAACVLKPVNEEWERDKYQEYLEELGYADISDLFEAARFFFEKSPLMPKNIKAII